MGLAYGGGKRDLVLAFMDFGPVIEGGGVCKALSMVPGLGDSVPHSPHCGHEWVLDPYRI